MDETRAAVVGWFWAQVDDRSTGWFSGIITTYFWNTFNKHSGRINRPEVAWKLPVHMVVSHILVLQVGAVFVVESLRYLESDRW